MHLFPSPYNIGPQACEGLGETPPSRFSTFVVVSALLHLLVLCSCIDWCREAAGPLFAGNAVIEIDLVSIPGPQPAAPAPEPSVTLAEKKPVVEQAPEIIEAPAAEVPVAPVAPIVEETPPAAEKPAEHTEAPAPVKKEVRTPDETTKAPSLQSSTYVNKTARPATSPAVATMKASPGNSGTGASVAVKANGNFAQAKGAASVGNVSPEQRYVDETFYYIKDLITRNLTYPMVARRMKWQGTVVVSFTVLENGTVEDIEVVTGSGHSVLDKNVVETIEQVLPFPAPPAAAEFTMPIKYTLRP